MTDSHSTASDIDLRMLNLERENEQLKQELNQLKVLHYSKELFTLMNNENFTAFKKLVLTVKYPINEFFSDSKHQHFNPLLYSTNENLDEFSIFLIKEMKANVNVLEKNSKWSPLMNSIVKRNTKIASLLLENGADVNVVDEDGFSPLAIAIDTQNEEMVSKILEYKPNDKGKDQIEEIIYGIKNENIVKLIRDYYKIKDSEDDISDNNNNNP